MRRSVVVAALVLFPDLLEKLHVEDSFVATKKGFIREIPQLASEPMVERNRKSLLAPVQDLSWQNWLHRLFENVLTRSAAELQRGRHRGNALHQVMV